MGLCVCHNSDQESGDGEYPESLNCSLFSRTKTWMQKRGKKYQSSDGCYGNIIAVSDIKDRSNNNLLGWDNWRPR